MARPHPSSWPSQRYNADMYDDREDELDSSWGYDRSRKDSERTPPRGYMDTQHERRGTAYREADNRYFQHSANHGSERGSRFDSRAREEQTSGRYNNRSRSRSPPYYSAPPNRTVILEGTMDLTQQDIVHELQDRLKVEGIEEVRLIKDRRTGHSRQFAFAQFTSTSGATKFLDQFYPSITMLQPHSSNLESNLKISVRVAYSREREDRDKSAKGEDDWDCDVCHVSNFAHRHLCFRCNAPRSKSTAHGIVVAQSNSTAHAGFVSTGDSDISTDGSASQFILLRGLEPGVSEELLAKGVSKLYKSKPDSEKAGVRTTKKPKIVSTSSDASLGARDGSLRRVLLIRDRKTGESWRYGFAEFDTVDDAQAAMAKFNALEKYTISSKPVSVSYIHTGVFVPVIHPVDDQLSGYTFSPLHNSAVRLMYWDEGAYVSELLIATNKDSSSTQVQENDPARFLPTAVDEGLVDVGKDGQPKPKRRKVEKDTKVVAPHLQFWTNQHAELHSQSGKEVPVETASAETAADDSEAIPFQSFADPERKCCFLCSRQFKTEAEVNKHERLSQLHRDNLTNQALVERALAKLSKRTDTTRIDNSAYRDRAKERRQVYNQPKQPAASRPAKIEVDNVEPSKPVPSKGAALLGKMGWSAGEGLGVTGSGMTEAIQTHLYSQGVGLGAEGGKIGDALEEADKQTKGSYADFLNKGKEKAKARFESMDS